MEWYVQKQDELKTAKPMISVCGDDCAVCPRFLAQTEEELHETAVFWYKAGWRESIVTSAEIKCTGCGSRQKCGFMLLPCIKEHNVSMCYECSRFPCEKVENTLNRSQEKMQMCREACESDTEFALFQRAFYEKEKNMRTESHPDKIPVILPAEEDILSFSAGFLIHY